MKTMTQTEYDKAPKGYRHSVNGQPYILAYQNGATILEPVEIIADAPGEIIYTEGKIVEHSWGYDQTNIDYFIITKRAGQFVTLQAIGKKNVTETGFMAGRCEPDPEKILDKKQIRRKVHRNRRTGEEIGISVNGCGWANLWEGKPSQWNNYA